MANVTTVLKYSLKTNIVKSVLTEIVSNTSRYYYTFGKSTNWETVTGLDEDDNVITISSEDNPPSAVDSQSYELKTRNDIILMKYIDANDVSIVIPRINWIPGLVYDMYDEYNQQRTTFEGATSIDKAKFYALTSDFNVYKCLFNNNRGLSSVSPFGTSEVPITLTDGYVWKFMYTIPLSFRNKFLSTDFMPVLSALTNQFYSKGSITSYTITNPGKEYTATYYKVAAIQILNSGINYTGVTITFPTPDSGTQAQATVNSYGLDGQILQITVTNQGGGYTSPPEPTITSTTGSGLTYVVIYDKDTTNGYTELKVTGDGYNADNPYTIKTVTVVNKGEFTTAAGGSLFSFPEPDLIGGRKPTLTPAFSVKTMPIKTGTWTATNSATVTVTVNAHGYSNGDNVNLTFTLTAGATNATSGNYIISGVTTNTFTIVNSGGSISGTSSGNVSATIVRYEVTSVAVTDPGYGYSFPFIFDDPLEAEANVFSATLYSAGVRLNFNENTQKNEAEILPLINLAGEIEALRIISPGIGYTFASVEVISKIKVGGNLVDVSSNSSDPGYVVGFEKATILLNFGIGDIESKQSNVELFAVDGSIEVIKVDIQGNGYSASTTTLEIVGDGTGCTAVPVIENGRIVKVNTLTRGSGYSAAEVVITGSGIGASLRPIISPKGGHGKDAVSELYARTINFTSRLFGEKNQGLSTTNDYRQVTILKNPRQYQSLNVFKGSVGSSCALFVSDITAANTATYSLLSVDDVLYFSEFRRFILVEKSIVSNKYHLVVQLMDNYLPTSGSTIYKLSGSSAYNINISSVVEPEFDKFSGEMLYTDNRVKFAPSVDQTVALSTLISF